MVKIERLRMMGEDGFALEICYLPGAEFFGLINAPLRAVRSSQRWSMTADSSLPMRTKRLTLLRERQPSNSGDDHHQKRADCGLVGLLAPLFVC